MSDDVISVKRSKGEAGRPDFIVVDLGAGKSERKLRDICHAVGRALNELPTAELVDVAAETEILLDGQPYHTCHG